MTLGLCGGAGSVWWCWNSTLSVTLYSAVYRIYSKTSNKCPAAFIRDLAFIGDLESIRTLALRPL